MGALARAARPDAFAISAGKGESEMFGIAQPSTGRSRCRGGLRGRKRPESGRHERLRHPVRRRGRAAARRSRRRDASTIRTIGHRDGAGQVGPGPASLLHGRRSSQGVTPSAPAALRRRWPARRTRPARSIASTARERQRRYIRGRRHPSGRVRLRLDDVFGSQRRPDEAVHRGGESAPVRVPAGRCAQTHRTGRTAPEQGKNHAKDRLGPAARSPRDR